VGGIIIIVSGLPASGKTTVAEVVAQQLGAPYLNSDKTRLALEFSGEYAPAAKDHIYQQLILQCEVELEEASVVVIDATFVMERWRAALDQMARRTGATTRWVFLHASEESTRERMKRQRKYSEADYAIYMQIRREYEADARPCLKLNSDRQSVAEMAQAIIEYALAGEPAPGT
jgi:hypothetical protein